MGKLNKDNQVFLDFFPTENMTPEQRINIMQSNFNSQLQQSSLPDSFYMDDSGLLKRY